MMCKMWNEIQSTGRRREQIDGKKLNLYVKLARGQPFDSCSAVQLISRLFISQRARSDLSASASFCRLMFAQFYWHFCFFFWGHCSCEILHWPVDRYRVLSWSCMWNVQHSPISNIVRKRKKKTVKTPLPLQFTIAWVETLRSGNGYSKVHERNEIARLLRVCVRDVAVLSVIKH